MSGYKTILSDYAEDSFVEKKSQFISYVKRIENEDEAKEFICCIKNKHKDATHNVYAYILKGTQIARFSDDGEPQGTAGMPALEVLKREELVGVCVVITRYFGGILLGAGGLVRAYAKAAKTGIDKAGIAEFTEHTAFSVTVSYGDYEKVTKDLSKYGCICSDTEFGADVTLKLSCEDSNFAEFEKYIADLSAGKVKCVKTGRVFAPKAK